MALPNVLGLPLAAPALFGGLLVMARLVALILALPGFEQGTLPVMARVMIAVTFALILDLGLGGLVVPIPDSPIVLGLMVLREIVIGAGLGLAVTLLLAATEAAGSVVGISMGLSLNVFVDPTSGDQTLAMGRLFSLIAALVFVVMGGPRLVLLTLFAHLQHFPVGVLSLHPAGPLALADAGGRVLVTALELAAPAVAITLALNIALAFVSRVVPAANIFGIGLGMLLLGGMLALALAGDSVVLAIDHGLHDLPRQMVELTGFGGS